MAEIQQNPLPAPTPASTPVNLKDQLSQVKLNLAKKSLAKGSIAGNAINSTIFAIIALAVVVGNYFLEAKFINNQAAATSVINALDYANTNIIPNNGIIRFSNEANFANPQVTIQQSDKNYLFYLTKGRLWNNFAISDAQVNFVIGKVVVMPKNATFDLAFDGEKIALDTYNGDVYVGFLNEGDQVSEFLDPYSKKFMNRLLVPRDTQVEIPLKKVTEEIAPLLFTKLVKEFKYAAIPTSKKESQWVADNLKEDAKFIETVKQQQISEIINNGLVTNDNVFSNFMFWAEENLTFVPSKKNEMIFDHLFAYLDDAIYYFNDGDTAKAQLSLNDFDNYLASFSAKIQNEDYPDRLQDYVHKLSVFGPDEDLYKVFVFVIRKGQDKFSIVSRLWFDVYRGLDINNAVAESALDTYYQNFDATLGDLTDKDFYRMYLSDQNQLFDNLLLRYPLFYKDGYFAMKNSIEKNLLSLYEGQLLVELKQAFVSTKIDFMKRLRKHFFDEEISVHDAKEIFSRLFEEVDELMPAESSSVAVIELFQEQLDDIDDFWGYLSSPEYHTNAYGLNHTERYENYLKERDTIYSFIDLQEDVLGEKIPGDSDTVSVVESTEEALKVNKDLTKLEVLEIENVDQRYVPIKAVLGGYPFTAKYDRDTDSLIEVYVYEELISDRAVKMDSLLSVLQEKFADLADDFEAASDDDELTVETSAQRYARIYIANKIGEYGFIADLENVSVVDELNAIYRVENVTMDGVDGVVVTFDILMNGEIVTNVLLTIDKQAQVLNGKYDLEEFSAIVAGGEFSEESANEMTNGGGVMR